jgi:hypothetical protein
MYIDINTWFTFEVSKSDDQCILAVIVHNGCFFLIWITDQLFKSYAFTWVVRSQSTLQAYFDAKLKKKKHPL